MTAPAGGNSVAATGNLNQGQASCTVSVDVTSLRAGTYTNGPGNVTAAGLDLPNSSSVTFQDADVSTVKTVSDRTPALGDTITYTLAVHNDGPTDARNVVVTDIAAAGIAPQSATPSQGTCSSPTTCDLGTVATGGDATITVTARAQAEGSAANSATVTTATPDRDSSNDTSSQTIDVHPSADLRIAKTASVTSVREGQDFRYTLTVTNAGPSVARAATVTDALPAGVALRSASSTRGSCGQSVPVVCTLGDLAADATATITLHVTATDAGRPQNTAVVESPTPDPNPANNSDHTTVTTDRLADLAIAKSASTAVVADGEAFDWTLRITNRGPSRALGTTVTDTRGVTVTDPIPASLRYLSATPTAGSCTHTQDAVVCNLGDIANGESAKVTLKAVTRRVGDAGNTASAVSRWPDDPNVADNLARSVVKAPAPRLTLRKTASRPTVSTGGHVTFRLRVRNAGGSTAHHVLVCDRLPAGLVATDTGPRARLRDHAHCWKLRSLAPGRTRTFTITATATASASGRRINRATLNADDARPLTASRSVHVDRIRALGGGVTG